MKKLLFLVFLLNSLFAMGEYRFVAKDTHGSSWYYDNSTIKKEYGAIYKVWIKMVFKNNPKGKNTIGSLVQLFKFDMDNSKTSVIQQVKYDRKGKLISTDNDIVSDWSYIVPGTIGETVFNAVSNEIHGTVNTSSNNYVPSEYSSSKAVTNTNSKQKGWVLINGVRWATRNVGAPGTFVASPESAGMFYQWNSKAAWPATGEVSGWNSNWNGGYSNPSALDTWSKINDPSPAGYHIPTKAQIESLLDATKVAITQITQNGVLGRKFTDKKNGNSIFLPALGFRSLGFLFDAGSSGNYWSATVIGADNAYYLRFNSLIVVAWGDADVRQSGHSIRPVAE